PCGSRSITNTRAPLRASAAARLTVVVVLPTPPFWFAIVKIRVASGSGKTSASRARLRRVISESSRARGVSAKPLRVDGRSLDCFEAGGLEGTDSVASCCGDEPETGAPETDDTEAGESATAVSCTVR